MFFPNMKDNLESMKDLEEQDMKQDKPRGARDA